MVNITNKQKDYSYNKTKLRVLFQENDPWFVLNDISNILGFGRPGDIRRTLKAENTLKGTVKSEKGLQCMVIVSRSGLEELLKRSRSHKVRGFRSWLLQRKLLMTESVVETNTDTASTVTETCVETSRVEAPVVEQNVYNELIDIKGLLSQILFFLKETAPAHRFNEDTTTLYEIG